MLRAELSDAFFAEAQRHLAILRFRHGVLISAALEAGAKGGAYALRQPNGAPHGWLEHAFGNKLPAYTFCLGERDESGAMALAELRARGINLVANALAQSADHVLGFFTTLRTELAFYVGALNLHDRLASKGEPICFPVPAPAAERQHAFRGLYDVCLALRLEQRVVGNDVTADGKNLVVVTGANQGGKSTFLRAVGVAQLMLQCGLFAPAESFRANLCPGLFTHYKREEDPTMESGKLDEELSRMNGIVDHLTVNAMVLLNDPSPRRTSARVGDRQADRDGVIGGRDQGLLRYASL